MTPENIKILICDDSMLVRKKLTISLNSLGVRNISEATDGEAAVERFKEFRPDLVFMDIVMPKMSGVDALKAILAEDPAAKVVMASSVGTQENLKEAINAGAFDFIQKPVSDSSLKALIDKLCVLEARD